VTLAQRFIPGVTVHLDSGDDKPWYAINRIVNPGIVIVRTFIEAVKLGCIIVEVKYTGAVVAGYTASLVLSLPDRVDLV